MAATGASVMEFLVLVTVVVTSQGELDLSADKRDIMMSLPPDKKWQIILSKVSSRCQHVTCVVK